MGGAHSSGTLGRGATPRSSRRQSIGRTSRKTLVSKQESPARLLKRLKRAEDALVECQLRWRGIFGNPSVGIATTDLKGRLLSANRVFEQITGRRRREGARRSAHGLAPEENRATSPTGYARLLRTMPGRGPVKVRYRREGGANLWLNTASSLVRHPDGRPKYVIHVVADIGARKEEQEEERRRALDQSRIIAAHLQRARVDERKKFSRRIHDELGQALASIKLELVSLLPDAVAGGADKARSESVLRLLDEAAASVRRIATDLRPAVLDDLGLAAAIEWAVQEFQIHSGIPCSLELPRSMPAPDPDLDTAVFRILQESLTNIAQHARATRVKVRLSNEKGGLTLEVRDNGRGISKAEISDVRSLGVLGMRERATLLRGELVIEGIPRRGTIVRARIPGQDGRESAGSDTAR